ncbi:hypothetical protein KHA93_03720 [Bacillus sp. FJAT-49732]|uniref:DUF4129 domain-containing protein n=1 Tax=Lederbergia citrisecunda TaxID=2833583 RepID=A0A942TJR2_9BACI|nr:hypothetical protein [Lederbergia citrisecunda]MBS4198758.1 hypothetical protein [Lederbergia citrisecunda]
METKEFSGIITVGQSQWSVIRNFLLKAILVSLLISPIHMTDSIYLTIAWPFLLLVTLGCVIGLGFQYVNTKGFMFNYFLFTIPTILILSIYFRLPFWLFLFSALFIFIVLKREVENSLNDPIDGGDGLLASTVIVSLVILILAAVYSLPFLYPVLLLVLLQFIIFSFGTFIRRYHESGSVKGKRIFFVKFSTGVIGILVFSLLVTYVLMNYLRKLLDYLLSMFAKVLIFISEPIISYFAKPLSNQEIENKLPIFSEEEMGKVDSEIVLNLESSQTLNYFALFIIIIVICFVAFYLYKKNKHHRRQPANPYISPEGFFTYVSPILERKGISPRYSDIDNEIRKAIKSLENYADKRNVGRYSYESLREWFNRIGISISEDSIAIYESVRYGSINATSEETNSFFEEMSIVKGKIEKISKNIKD